MRSSTLATLLLLLSTAPAFAQEAGGKIQWTPAEPERDFAKTAIEIKKDLVVYFTARWVPACAKLDRGPLSDDEVVKLSERWGRYLVDLSDKEAYDRAKGRQKLAGLPTVRFYGKDGVLVDEIVAAGDADVFAQKFRGEGRIWKTRPMQVGGPGEDTHRVFLRNGGTVDGCLLELTDEVALLRWDPQSEVSIAVSDIRRIEWLTIRRVAEPPREMEIPRAEPQPAPPAERAPKEIAAPPAPKDAREAVDRLLAKLKDPKEKEAAARRLSETGPEGLAYGVSLLDRLSPEGALVVLGAVQASGDKAAAPALRQKLSVLADSEVLAAAIGTLAALNDQPSLEAILKALSHTSVAVRCAAADALGVLGGRDELRPLCTALVESDGAVRFRAEAAVSRLALRLKEPALVLSSLRACIREVPEARRDRVPAAAAAIKTPEATLFLLEMLASREPAVVLNVVRAVGSTKDRAAVPALLELLGASRGPDAATAAAGALQEITGQRFGTDAQQWKAWWATQSK